MWLQRSVTLLLGRVDTRRCGARRRRRARCCAVARATHWRDGVTRSSSPRLLVGASVVEAHRLGGDRRMAWWRRPRRLKRSGECSR
jgi:hypothetical protein